MAKRRPNGKSRLLTDLNHLDCHLESLSDGQAKIAELDDNLEYLDLDIMPNGGFYRGAKLRFRVLFSAYYPLVAPRLKCLDCVYHPNIGSYNAPHSVCVSLLDDWESSMSLDHVVIAILFLMYHPCVEDALSDEFGEAYPMAVLESNIRLTLRGGVLNGRRWPRLLIDNDEGVEENSNADDVACDLETGDSGSNTESECGESSENEGNDVGAVLENHHEAQLLVALLNSAATARRILSQICFVNSENICSLLDQLVAYQISKLQNHATEGSINRDNPLAVTGLNNLNTSALPSVSNSSDDVTFEKLCGSSRINALFSIFRREDGIFQTFDIPVLDNIDNQCDVD